MINSYRRDMLDTEINRHNANLFGVMLDIGGGSRRGNLKEFIHVTDHIIIDNNIRTRPNVVGDAEHLPFKKDSFHSIKCTEVLEYLNTPEQAVSEMHRVSKDVAGIMVSTPFNLGIHYDKDLVRFTKFKLEQMFNDAGFRIVYLSEQGRYFTVLGYMLKQAILNTKSKARWLLYWTFPILDLMTGLDNWNFVEHSQFLSSFTTGYFISAILKKED